MYMYNKDWINKGEYTDTLWKKTKKTTTHYLCRVR